MEKTLAIIKPDGVKQGVIGEVIKRLENNQIKIIAMNKVLERKAWFHPRLCQLRGQQIP